MKDEEIEKLKNQIKNMTLQDVIKKKPLETIEEKEEVRESVVDTVKKPKAVMEEPKQIPIVPKVEHIIKKEIKKVEPKVKRKICKKKGKR